MTRPDRRAVALAATTVGVYVLIMAGATSTVVDAASACSTWPACAGPPSIDDPRLLVAWGHRLVALAVGVLLAGTAAICWRGARRRVRAAIGLAVALYPIQIGLGAAVTAAPGGSLSGLHLVAGMAIFAGIVLALAWTLEPDDSPDGPASRIGTPATDPGASPDADAETGSPTPRPSVARPSGPLAVARAYLALTKPRLMWLLCLVAAAGMALAAGPALSARTAVATLLGGVLAIGASGTFNHVLERDLDRRMERTADRPLPTDRVGVRNALAFGGLLAAAAVGVFLWVDPLAAALGAAAIAYYSVVYTLLLKPNTAQNTVIGGLAGSFPALIGAAAVTGSIGLSALVLAAVIFLWTPAHFYNLAMAYREDYARGGVPMFPVVRGEAATRRHVIYWLGATMLAAALLPATGGLDWVYAAVGVAFGAVFLWSAVRLAREPTRAAALRSFHASNAYLGALLVAVVVDALAI